jgi:hypothetical protein
MMLPLLPSYISHNSILVVNRKGLLKVLYCPFGVITISQIDNIPPLTKMIVEEVGGTLRDLLIYIINGRSYSYKDFQILMRF